MWDKLRSVWKLRDLRSRVLLTVGLLFAARLLAHIPAPGIPATELLNKFQGGSDQFVGLIDLFSGGAISKLSIAMLGVGPYITSSIIFQLMAYVVPSLEALQKEGQYGQQKIQQYTRYLTVPLAFLQGYGTLAILRSQGLLTKLSLADTVTVLVSIMGGTLLLMWLGEVISERGIGNGISLLITLGILSGLPRQMGQALSLLGVNISTKGIDLTSLDRSLLIQYGLIAFLAVAVLAAVILITQAIRNIPVTYSRGVRAGVRTAVPSHLSLRLNSAGVIPIIFAISILITPAFLAQFFLHARSQTLQNIAQFVISITKANSPYYAPLYFLLVVVFTFFYTFVVFQPKKIAENLGKQSGFIPGVRPGSESERYLHNVILRLTVFGALFLGLVAVLPAILQQATGNTTFALGGTGLLIVVSVIIETMLAIRAQIVTATYDMD